MKKFFALLSVCVLIILALSCSIVSFAEADETMGVSDNVIFISDNATVGGDGSSADSPLYPEAVPDHKINEQTNSSGVVYGNYHLKTALYQAAYKLRDTGGTIVICGPVVIDGTKSYGSGSGSKDFIFPSSDEPLHITSTYDGVDYAKTKGAYWQISSPAQIILDSPTLIDNITIKTKGEDRVLCANGNRLVMGDGISCSSVDTNPDGDNYLSIAGGTRYKGLTADTDVTIKSGYYNHITGSIWGLDVSGYKYVHNGNVNLNIIGGTFRGNVCGGSIKAATTTLNGDVVINIHKNAKFGVPIYGAGQARFETAGHSVTINVYGGAYYDASANINKHLVTKEDSSTTDNYPADSYKVNLASVSDSNITARSTGSTKSKVINNLVTSAVSSGYDVLYPAAWATSVSCVTEPTVQYVLRGDAISSSGAKLNVSFKNKYDNSTVYSNVVEYDEANQAFAVTGDTSKAGTLSAQFKYGTTAYCTKNVNVLECPDVDILGARIKTDTTYQKLRFIAKYTEKLSPGMSIERYGVLTVRSDLVYDSTKLNFEDTYGMAVVTPKEDDEYSKNGSVVTYSCTDGTSRINRFNIDQIAVAFVELSYNGETFYRYSEAIRRNPYEIAKRACAEGSVESAETKAFLKENVIDAFEGYDNTKQYETTMNYRNRVVNYMKAQMSMQWTPSESFWINNPKDATGVTTNLYFEKGKTYYGIPYTNNNFSQEETFSELINDGILSLSEIPGVVACGTGTENEAVALENYKNFPGSDCSTAVITAWNTVLNGRLSLSPLTATVNMVPGNDCGVIPVGDYDYDYEKYQNDTSKMVADSANQAKILAAYDLLKPGDAIVHYSGSGHARLVVSVDTSARTITTIECANWSIPNCRVTSGNGTSVTLTNNNTSWKQLTYNYDYLIRSGYVPITIPELATGHSDGEYTLITDLDLEKDLPRGKLSGKAVSNRQIISVDVTVSDGTNTFTVKYQPSDTAKASAVHTSIVDLSNVDMSNVPFVSGKTYSLNLNVRVSGLTSSTPAVKLIQNYSFVAK